MGTEGSGAEWNRMVGGVWALTFRGVLAPGWVLPCNCGLVAPERPFGHGVLIFRDIVEGRSASRSLPVILDKVKNP